MKTEISHKSVDLCDSCQNCTKVRGYGNELKLCRSIGSDLDSSIVSFPVESCTAYEPKGTTSKWEMEQMAIYIEKRKDAPGFRFTKHTNAGEIEIK